jgi:hypothetical protein
MSETVHERELRHRIRDFLRSPAVRRVHFQFGRVRITPQMLEAVALRLQDWNHIERPAHGHQVRVRSFQPMSVRISTTRLPAHAEAMYDPDANRITLRSAVVDSTDTGRATILHESVHASQDVACRRNHAYPDESVAFLSEYVWYRAINRIVIPPGQVERVAHDLSQFVIDQPGYSFTAEQQRQMTQAVRGRYSPHGVSSSTEYGYNGVRIR